MDNLEVVSYYISEFMFSADKDKLKLMYFSVGKFTFL